MKILFITDLYPITTSETTTPHTLHNFVKEWIRQGHEVDVIKPNFLLNSFLRGKKFYKTGFYEFDGVRVFNVNYYSPFLFNIDAKMQRCKDAKKVGQALPDSAAIQKESHTPFTIHHSSSSHYDVVIAHMPSGIIFANKLNLDAPLVCGVHCSDIEVLTNPIYSFYFKKQLEKAYKKAKKIACRSHVLQKKFSDLMPDYAEKTFVASSGIEPEGKRERGKEEREGDFASQNHHPFPVPRSPFTVLTCANLIKRKNIDKLILAVKDLEGFKLKIIGDGNELNNLQKTASENVEFLGRISHEKVLEEMQNADIFILPSVNETFGMVYLEAMASGCITVCTRNDGIDGIIKDEENGFLTEPTAEGIKETLLRIKNLSDLGGASKDAPYNLQEIMQNSLEAIKEYTPENCAKNYLDKITK